MIHEKPDGSPMMAKFKVGHILALPNGYFLRKDDDNQWQVGKDGIYLAFHIANNVPVGRGGSFDEEAEQFALGLTAISGRVSVETLPNFLRLIPGMGGAYRRE